MALADVIQPRVLADMVLEKLTDEVLDLAGVDTSNQFPIGTKGTKWEIPYQQLIGDLQVDGEGVTLVPTAATQTAYSHIVTRKGQAYKVPDIDRMAANQDPGQFLSAQIAQIVAKDLQASRFRILEGAIPSANRKTVYSKDELAVSIACCLTSSCRTLFSKRSPVCGPED